jgi:uncharacterized RDD family membrane protein YckC
MIARRDRVVVRTPEGIVFSLPLAGPVTRAVALAIDLACIAAIGTAIGAVFNLLGMLSTDLMTAALTYAYFAVSVAYGMLAEWFWRGQTVGKHLLNLRVMDQDGLKLHPSQIVIRNLLRFVDALPGFYLIGGLAMLAGRRAQRLGDFAAGTIVVRTAPALQPDLDQILAGKYNSLRDHPIPAARLCQRVAPDDARLALRAVLRRDDMDPAARVTLFREIAGHFRTLSDFPPEATAGLADEQYVRDVLDLLFRPRGGDRAPAPPRPPEPPPSGTAGGDRNDDALGKEGVGPPGFEPGTN